MSKGKICTGCGETKPIDQFYKHRGSQDGFNYRCKTCERSFKQSEKGKLAYKKYRKSDKGKRKDARHGKSKKRELSKKRYRQSDKGNQTDKKYKQSAKGQRAKKKGGSIRRTNQTKAGGSYTTSEWLNLCKFYDYHCLKCNHQFPFEQLTVDHVKSVSKGGTSFIWNLQPLCKSCNSSKGTKKIDYRKTLPDWINRDGPVWQQDTLF